MVTLDRLSCTLGAQKGGHMLGRAGGLIRQLKYRGKMLGRFSNWSDLAGGLIREVVT